MEATKPLKRCEECNKDYYKEDSYRAHMRNVHDVSFAVKKISCSKDNCDEKFINTAQLRDHLTRLHNIEIFIVKEEFFTEEEFEEWKKDYQQETNERYVKNTGDKISEKRRYLVFDCNRSGFEKNKPLLDKNRADKVQRSRKLNAKCPAQMILTHKHDKLELTFYKTHTHDIEIKHVELAEKTCETVAGMLKAGFAEE